MDNPEWTHGYTQPFGILRVDRDRLERVPKQSARWYSHVIAHHGLDE